MLYACATLELADNVEHGPEMDVQRTFNAIQCSFSRFVTESQSLVISIPRHSPRGAQLRMVC
jgi:hypothetical protein